MGLFVVVMAVWRSQWPFFHLFHTARKLVEDAIRKTVWHSECFDLGARACSDPSQKCSRAAPLQDAHVDKLLNYTQKPWIQFPALLQTSRHNFGCLLKYL